MSDQGTNVSGTAWSKAPYITVNFIWLTYPAIVFLMVTMFLFATTMQSRNTPLWKSSALALLYSRDADEGVRSASERENISKRTSSRLERTGTRHRLIHVDEAREKV